ncbi:hypothetical protein BDV18DRAFT_124725 [Aspergillus unguis]
MMEFLNDYSDIPGDVSSPMETDAQQVRTDDETGSDVVLAELGGQQPVDSSRKRLTFLDLPEKIKIRILQYAGLLRTCLVDFRNEKFRLQRPAYLSVHRLCSTGNRMRLTGPGWTDKWQSPYSETCDHPALPLNVLLASRAARQEVGALFFSHNRFTATLDTRHEFINFVLATKWGLQHIRYLNLNLGQLNYRNFKIGGQGYHRVILRIWTEFCQNSTQKMPSLRHFSMKCKVRDLEAASKLIRTMDPFPTLLHCAFHFGDFQDDDIQPVIKRAAWRLTGNLSDQRSPFRFAELPKEIQIMILEHVLVQRLDPYLPASERATSVVGFLDRKLRPSTHAPHVCCGTCSPSGVRCFCEGSQTAFSTSCICFTSPLPYFLVNRAFYQECRRLFYSKNHFTCVEDEPEPIMRFLISIPTSSFMQIRQLSFKFPLVYRSHRSSRQEEAGLLSWAVLRRFILEHFDLSRLSLSIVDLGSRGGSSQRNKYLRRMLKEFTNLPGLREFRVYLADDPSFEKELEQAVTGKTTVGRYRPYNVS